MFKTRSLIIKSVFLNVFNRSRIHASKLFCNKSNDGGEDIKLNPALSSFKLFKDEDAPIIIDVEEEKSSVDKTVSSILPKPDEFRGLNLKRGKSGVFELEDILELIKSDKVKDVFVLDIPKELNYIDFMVIGTCMSRRHVLGLSEFVIKVFKKKRFLSDRVPSLISENSDWMALDLGNIVLHLMTKETRIKYDLESLWSVGPSYDVALSREEDSLMEIFKKHNISLDDFKPADRLG